MAGDVNDPVLLQLGYISLLLQKLVELNGGRVDDIDFQGTAAAVDDVTYNLVVTQRSPR